MIFDCSRETGTKLAMLVCGLIGGAFAWYPSWLLVGDYPDQTVRTAILAVIFGAGALANGAVPWLVETGSHESGIDE